MTKQILAYLIAANRPVRTFDLAHKFGPVSAALDELQAQRKIIRIRGVGATVEAI